MKSLNEQYLLHMNHFLQMPNLRDQESVQKFFLQEVQLGEELLASGNIFSV